MPGESSPSYLSDGPASDPALALRSFAAATGGCMCPLCTGQALDEEAGISPVGYRNADERTGIAVNGKPSLTSDQVALKLVGVDPRTGGPAPSWGPAGEPFEVTYAFRANAPWDIPGDATGFEPFNAAQIRATELAIQGWADAANITFVRVGFGEEGNQAYSDDAMILFANYTEGESGASAFAQYPGPNPESGDVWVNRTVGTNSFPLIGNSGMQVLVHEIGHAIGLAHPGPYNVIDNDNNPKTPPPPITYAKDAVYYEDSRQYTVMSYFSVVNTGGDYGPTFPASPQLDDIRAIQVAYGVNMTTRTGDTVYGFNSTAGRDWFAATNSSSRVVFAVWDAGGTDTFDFSGYSQNQLIELREGFFSNVGALTGNVAIAHGAEIENAIGGFGADTINGNAVSNRIEGNGGADRVFAGAGADTIDGGEGSGYLRGEEGNDSIGGGSQFDDIQGNTGNDTEFGWAGDDWVVGGKDDDVLFGNTGDDLVYGNLGDDQCVGGEGNDIVRGGQGNDTLLGDAGDDFLAGDRGEDTMAGGGGADQFHTFAGAGLDRVLDFNFAEGDRVSLDPGTVWSVVQVDADTVITLGTADDRMILVGVQMTTLGAGWILGD